MISIIYCFIIIYIYYIIHNNRQYRLTDSFKIIIDSYRPMSIRVTRICYVKIPIRLYILY